LDARLPARLYGAQQGCARARFHAEAERYFNIATHDEFSIDDEIQLLIIDEAQRAVVFQNLRLHHVATETTHAHLLVSWRSKKDWRQIRTSLKSSLTLAIRERMRKQCKNANAPIFSHGSSRKRIRNWRHFRYWLDEYGPSHSGWKWTEGEGLFK
jgi:hypothetical protein